MLESIVQKILNPVGNNYDVIDTRTSAQTNVGDVVILGGIIDKPFGGSTIQHTTGTIQFTGVMLNSPTYGIQNNQVLADYASKKGDSGSPIFAISSGNDVSLYGIHVGANCFSGNPLPTTTCPPGIRYAIFSPWELVQADLNLQDIDGSFLVIPQWITDIAKWWSQGLISDNEYAGGLAWLIDADLINITANQGSNQGVSIPEWMKRNAMWWSQGLITDQEYANAIEYLIEQGIIILGGSVSSNSSLSLYELFVLTTLSDATITPTSDTSRGCEPNCFVPNAVMIDSGDTVIFTNTDSTPHTFTSGTPFSGPDNVWNSDLVFPGQNFAVTLNTPGTYTYFSILDPWMQGTVVVNSLTSAPIANPTTVSAVRAEPQSITLTASDYDLGSGESLEFIIISLPFGGSLNFPNIVPNDTPFSATIQYTSFSGTSGSDPFTFQVRDDTGVLSNVATVTVDVSIPDLTRPTANSQSLSIMENQATQLTLTGFDPEGDPLTFIILPGTPASATISSVTTINDNTVRVTYTPNNSFTGTDTLSFRVTDGSQTSGASDVTITVIPHVNTAPIAVNDVVTINEDSESNTLNILSNDIDVDIATQNDSLLISSFDDSATIGGTLTLAFDNLSMIFVPNGNFDGDTSFTYVTEDSEGTLSNSAIVTINIIPEFDAPTAVNDSAIVGFNSADNVIDVLSNDFDPDTGDILNVTSIDTTGTRGTAAIFGFDGFAVSFIPETNFIGDTSFSYTASDLAGNTATAQVDVTINAFDGQSIFVIDDGASKVNAYDGNTGKFLGNYIASGAGGLTTSHSIVVAPTNDFLFVSNPNTNQILRFDLATGTFSDFVSPTVLTSSTIDPASSFPSVYSFDVKEDGNLLASYSPTNPDDLEEMISNSTVLSNYSVLPASVAVYDGYTGRYIGEFVRPDLVSPDIASIVNSVVVYDGAGNKEFYLNAALDGLSSPRDMIFDSDGSFLVANAGGGNIIRYDGINGSQIEVFVDQYSSSLAPLFLEFGPNDNYLYVGNAATGGVLRYNDTTGIFFDKPILRGENGLDAISDMSFGSDGNLYILDSTDDILQYGGTSLSFLSQFIVGSADPNTNNIGGMTWGPDGKLYLSNQISSNTNTLLRYDATGSFEEIFSTEIEIGPMSRASRLLFASSPFSSPSTITDLTATTVSTSRVQLDWSTPSSDGGSFLVGYEIQRKSQSETLFSTLIDPSVQGIATTFVDTNLASSTQYTYRVITESLVDSSAPSNEESAITLDTSQNVPPVAKNDAETIVQDTTVIIDVLSNDDDLDDDPIVLGPVTTPSNGVASIVTVSNVDMVSYTPDSGFIGIDMFDYTITANSDVDTATVYVVVNDPDAVGIYVASRSTNSVPLYSLNGTFANNFVDSGDGLNTPKALAFGPDGHLYVASTGTSQILRFDTVTGEPLGISGNPGDAVFSSHFSISNALGFLFSEDGSFLYVSDQFGTITKYDVLTSVRLGTFGDADSSTGLISPEKMVWGPDGHMYVSSRSNEIMRYHGMTGQALGISGTTGDAVFSANLDLDRPQGLAWGPDGNLYVGNDRDNNVVKLDGTTGVSLGEFVARTTNLVDDPSALLFDLNGDLYVVNEDDDNIQVFFGPNNPNAGEHDHTVVIRDTTIMDRPLDMAFGPKPASLPGQIIDLTTISISSSQINLDWSVPSDGGLPIFGYHIKRQAESESSFSVLVSNTGTTDTDFSDTGLTSDTQYDYRVFAINTDGVSTSTSNTASATTIGSNTAPTVNDLLNETTNEDTTFTITLSGVDSDGDSLSFSIVTSPSKGTLGAITPVTINSTSVLYTPTLDANGADSFTYRANDGTVDSSNIATVSITITPQNDNPIDVDDSATTNEDTSVTIQVLDNDTDVDTLIVTDESDDFTPVSFEDSTNFWLNTPSFSFTTMFAQYTTAIKNTIENTLLALVPSISAILHDSIPSVTVEKMESMQYYSSNYTQFEENQNEINQARAEIKQLKSDLQDVKDDIKEHKKQFINSQKDLKNAQKQFETRRITNDELIQAQMAYNDANDALNDTQDKLDKITTEFKTAKASLKISKQIKKLIAGDTDLEKIDDRFEKIFKNTRSDGTLITDPKIPVYLRITNQSTLDLSNYEITAQSDGIIVLKLTPTQIDELSLNDNVGEIRLPDLSESFSHDVSQGVSLTFANDLHSKNITGNGITVGIIDDSFITSDTEIASNIKDAILFDSGGFCGDVSCGKTFGNSHGTAVAEIVVDMAPDVNLVLYTIANTVDFVNAVDNIITRGDIDIITISLGFPTVGGDGTTGFFRDGTSIVAKAVNRAQDAGILVTTAAGNDAKRHWMGVYTPSTISPVLLNLTEYQSVMEFRPSETGIQKACLPVSHAGWTVASWNAWDITTSDYDLFLFDGSMAGVISYSAIDQQTIPSSPIETIFDGTGFSGCLVVSSMNSTQNHLFHITTVGGSITSDHISAGSINTPADATGSFSVGAINHATNILESFSSRGPTDDGRVTPQICGPDGILSHQASFDPFFGTSSSAPHVAGAAALIKHAQPHVLVNDIREQLINHTTVDQSYSVDNLCGSGLLSLAMISITNGANNSTSVITNATSLNGMTPEYLSISSVSDPAHGTATKNLNNTITYLPDANYSGEDTFSYTISDGNGGTDTATVTVTVIPVNDAPVLNLISNQSIEPLVEFSFTASALDPDMNDVLAFSLSREPTGAVIGSGSGLFTWTPTISQEGAFTFDVLVSDNSTIPLSDTQSIIITVVTSSTTHKISASDGLSYDIFGVSTSVDGNTLIVGSTLDGGNGAGSVYVFENSNSTWTQTAKLIQDNPKRFDRFGGALSMSGDTLFVGFPNYDDNIHGRNLGTVYIFEKDAGVWQKNTQLILNDGKKYDSFGVSVSVNSAGNTVIVGSPYYSVYGFGSGAVTIFEKNATTNTWNQTAHISPADGAKYDYFGYTVNIHDENTIAVSSLSDKVASHGTVRVYEKNSNDTWELTAKLSPDDTPNHFGRSSAMWGDTIAVGAEYYDNTLDDMVGAVYTFENNGTAWSQSSKLIQSDFIGGDYFGYSLSLSNGILVSGTPNFGSWYTGVNSFGSAYIYEQNNNTWNTSARVGIPVNDLNDDFGKHVSVSSNGVVLASAPYGKVDEVRTGYVKVYSGDFAEFDISDSVQNMTLSESFSQNSNSESSSPPPRDFVALLNYNDTSYDPDTMEIYLGDEHMPDYIITGIKTLGDDTTQIAIHIRHINLQSANDHTSQDEFTFIIYDTANNSEKLYTVPVMPYLSEEITSNTNLLNNPYSVASWDIITNGGNGWLDYSSGQTNWVTNQTFATSYKWNEKSITIPFNGIDGTLTITEDYSKTYCGDFSDNTYKNQIPYDQYYLTIELFDINNNLLTDNSTGIIQIIEPCDWSRNWHTAELTISEIPQSTSSIIVTHGGVSGEYWAGWYGPVMRNIELVHTG